MALYDNLFGVMDLQAAQVLLILFLCLDHRNPKPYPSVSITETLNPILVSRSLKPLTLSLCLDHRNPKPYPCVSITEISGGRRLVWPNE